MSVFGVIQVGIFPHSDWIYRICIQSECGKIWTRIAPNRDTFHAVWVLDKHTKVMTNRLFTTIKNLYSFVYANRLLEPMRSLVTCLQGNFGLEKIEVIIHVQKETSEKAILISVSVRRNFDFGQPIWHWREKVVAMWTADKF